MWVKRTDAKAAQYSAVRDIDPSLSVDELKARWLSDEKLDVRPSLVSLRRVKLGPGKPGTNDEEAAKLLDDPSATLREADLAPTTWLLAEFASSLGATARHARCTCRSCQCFISYARL